MSVDRDEWTKAVITDVLGLGDAEAYKLASCPRCGKQPELTVELAGRDLIELRYTCRRWWSLRLCFAGFPVLDEIDSGVYGRNVAARAWNRAVAATPVAPARRTRGVGSDR